MASIFGDESADEKAQEVFAVAGILGFDWQWDMAVKDWREITKGEEFHAAEWESKYAKDPDRTKHRERLESYKQLIRVVRLSGLRGWGVGLDLASFRASFPGVTQEIAYHKCFAETADRLVQEAEKHGYSDLEFIFDHRQGEHNTGVLYDWMTSQPEWAKTNIFFDTKIAFDSRKNPRVQIADLLARETMKGLQRWLKGLSRRKSFTALATSGYRIQFDYLVGEYFSTWKARMPEMEKKTGMDHSEYFAWLKKNKLPNNLSSGLKFLIWLDSKNLRKKNGA